MFDDSNETICDDSNMYLDTDGIFTLTPESLDSKMLLEPLEEQFKLPPIFIKECNILGFEMEVIGVVSEGASEFRRVINDASDRDRIIRFVSLACETYGLVTKNIVPLFLKVKTAFNLIGRMKFLSNDKERSRAIDFIESCKVKVPSIKHIASEWLVSKPVHGVDIMHLSISDSVENRNLCNDVNLRVNSYSRLARSELRPSENREAKVNRSGVNSIESPMQFKLSCDALRLGDCHHMKCKLLKDSIISNGVRFRKYLPVDTAFPEPKEKRLVSMSDCYVCKFPKASTSEQLSEHEIQQMVPMRKRPSSCPIIVLDC